MFANGEASGVGAVVRNENGEVMAALSAKGDAVADSEGAEVLACCKALAFAVDAGFSDLIIEVDNVTVMKTISSAQHNLSRLGLVYEDIRCIVAGLWSVSLSFFHRSVN